MNPLGPRQQLAVGLILVAVMAATRFNHFGSPVSLPDASLAVFFLAGLYLSRAAWFPVFIVEAGLMDWVSIAGGVSDWCVTAAYGMFPEVVERLSGLGDIYLELGHSLYSLFGSSISQPVRAP